MPEFFAVGPFDAHLHVHVELGQQVQVVFDRLSFLIVLVQVARRETEKLGVLNCCGTFCLAVAYLTVIVHFVNLVTLQRTLVFEIENNLEDGLSLSCLALTALSLIVHLSVRHCVVAAGAVGHTELSHVLRLEAHQESFDAELSLTRHVVCRLGFLSKEVH